MRFIPIKGGLSPHDQAARDFLRQCPDDRPLELEHLHDRDGIFHKKIFAHINELAKALHRDPEQLRAELLYQTGHFQRLGIHRGQMWISIDSMSRRHMTDDELRTFWDYAVDYIKDELLPQIKDAAERERLAATLSPGG